MLLERFGDVLGARLFDVAAGDDLPVGHRVAGLPAFAAAGDVHLLELTDVRAALARVVVARATLGGRSAVTVTLELEAVVLELEVAVLELEVVVLRPDVAWTRLLARRRSVVVRTPSEHVLPRTDLGALRLARRRVRRLGLRPREEAQAKRRRYSAASATTGSASSAAFGTRRVSLHRVHRSSRPSGNHRASSRLHPQWMSPLEMT